MSSKPPSSLKLQLLRWVILPLLTLLVANAWLSERAAESTARATYDRLLTASADAIAEDVEFRDGQVFVDLPYAALQLLESNIQERIFYRVVAPDGTTATGYDDLPLPPHGPPAGQEVVLYTARYKDEAVHLVAHFKPVFEAAGAGPILIIVAETGEARQAFSHQVLVESLSRQGLLIGVAMVLLLFGLSQSLRSLTRLRRSVEARPATDLGPVDPKAVQSEVRPLVEALNLHMARISGLLASRERFIADASHQMRTPLSEMRMQVEFALRQDDRDLWRGTLADVRADIDRVSRLVSQMLVQARSEPEVLADQRIDPVDLAEVCREVAMELIPAARRRDADLSLEAAGGPCLVAGNAVLLGELVANLVGNAIHHGRSGGAVVVRLGRGAGTVLEVQDDGPGIDPSERARVFERFHRAPGTAVPGSGLGLAIVRNICIVHGAGISLDDGPGGRGLLVRVRFPPMPTPPGAAARAPVALTGPGTSPAATAS